jgi:hypothetical protein
MTRKEAIEIADSLMGEDLDPPSAWISPRQYVAVYAPSKRNATVLVEGLSSDLVARERVSELISELTGWVPEFISWVPVTNSANHRLVI